MAEVPDNRRWWGLEGALSKDDRETGKHDVDSRKDGDSHKDNKRDLVVNCVDRLDEAGEEQEDCRVYQG